MTKHFLIFLVTFLVLPLAAIAKNYDVSFKRTPAEAAITQLEQVSGHDFVYQKELVAGSRILVNGSFKNESLEKILDEVIGRQLGLKWKIVNNTVVLSKPAAAKGRIITVKGIVRDNQGDPIPGASVKVIGEPMGVATDADGQFTLNVPMGATLAFTYIGMQPQDIRVTDTKPLDVEMQESTNMLSEVVITGYQELKKEKMTGAITTISADKLEDRYTPNLIQNLEGRVAGLSTYGGKPVIRGLGTLHGSTNPLLVVDGLPIEGSLDDLNPYDIASINVLKDAAASAIYGARAGNGIIVVTTKSANKKGKIDIDFTSNITVYEKANFDYADNFYMTPEQQINAESDYWNYYFFNNDGEINDPIGSTKSSIERGSQLTPLNLAYYRLAAGEINQQQFDQTVAKLKTYNYARDYEKNMTHRQVLQQYNLSLRGSSDKFRNNLVLNYKKDNTQLLNHHSDWLNVYYKGSYDIASWLTATVSINGIYANNQSYGNDYNSSMFNPWAYAAYQPFYNEDGTVAKQYPWYCGSNMWTPEPGCEDLGVDPVFEAYQNTMKTRTQSMRYHADLVFKILPGLSVNTQFVYEVDNVQQQQHATQESHAAKTIKNAFAYLDNGEVKYKLLRSGGFLQTNNTNGNYWTARFQANYSRTFFDKHDIAVIAGLEFRQTENKGVKSLALGYDEQLQNSSTHTVDFGEISQWRNSPYYMSTTGNPFAANQFAFSPYLENGMGIVPEVRHRYGSGYFNATYTYDERYNVFGSFRKDYADVYGLNSKFRGKPLWSVGLGWNIHNEEFMHDQTWADFLKLRFSYGVTGNIYQGATSLMTATSTGLNSTTNLPLGEVVSPANPDLRWEQNRTTNVGLDFSFFGYRLRGSIDWYNKDGKDIFNNTNLDPTFGFTSMVANVASIRNRGIEISAAYDWFRANHRRDFSWTTSMTLTFNSNKVTDVENDATRAYQLVSTPYKTGYPVNAMWSYRFAGIGDQPGQQGRILFYGNNDAKTTAPSGANIDCLEFSGQEDPKNIIAMDNTFRWNGLSLGVVMVYYGGHRMRALAETETFSSSWTNPVASYFLNAWTPEHPTETPGIGRWASTSIGSEPRYSNKAVHDASFIKIRNIVLGYDIPEHLLKHVGINNLRLTFQINDPKAIWTANKIGVDPETLGIRGRSSYVFGLNVNI